MRKGNRKRSKKRNRNHQEKKVESIRKVPKALQKAMTEEELGRVLALTDSGYVAWLIEHYGDELELYARSLARKFYWLEQKYGEDISPWLLLHDAKDRFVERADKFAAYKRPIGAMKRTMFYMAVDKARDLRRRFGLDADAVSLDDQAQHISLASSILVQDESLMVKELLQATAKLRRSIPKEYRTGLRYAVAHFVRGKKVVDIAAKKGIHHGNVSRPMWEALRYLNRQLVALGCA